MDVSDIWVIFFFLFLKKFFFTPKLNENFIFVEKKYITFGEYFN